MTKFSNVMNTLVTKLMILVCTLSVLVTPVQTVYAASFEDAFRYFGETLQTWEKIETISKAVSAEDLADDFKTIECVYHQDDKAVSATVKVTNAHISVAEELVESFVNATLWNGFRDTVGTDPGNSLVKVDYNSKKVSANKQAGCSSAMYSQLKSQFSEVSGGTAANDFVFDVLGNNIKPESNEITDTILSKVFVLSNTIIYIGISLISIYFALTVVADLAFLMAPTFRRYLVTVDSTGSASWLDPEKDKKVRMLVGGLVSETALMSLGCKKEKGQIGLSDARSIGVDFMVPDWKYFLVHKSVMWIVITIFLIIFWSGQLGQLASLVLEFMTWVYNSVLNLLRS